MSDLTFVLTFFAATLIITLATVVLILRDNRRSSISVVSTEAFPQSGYLTITAPDGTEQVVRYKGKTATSFTPCPRGSR